jgi:hypothetical protein
MRYVDRLGLQPTEDTIDWMTAGAGLGAGIAAVYIGAHYLQPGSAILEKWPAVKAKLDETAQELDALLADPSGYEGEVALGDLKKVPDIVIRKIGKEEVTI